MITDFLRQKEMTYHCCCKTFYDPVVDVQRYCEECATWYHIDCCKPLSGVVRLPRDIKQKIYQMPIMRGALGSANNEWMISGNGQHKEAARGWARARNFPDNWEDQLGGDFMTFVEYASFTYYNCPSGCDHAI